MITQATAARIWNCYREIAAAEKLLADMSEEEAKRPGDRHEPELRDVFGRRQKLQLGVPSGENGHRLFDVDAELAKSVIRAHIAKKESELVSANEQARIELDTQSPRGPQDAV